MRKVCIVGAGFSGAVIAHQLATAGYTCDVYESRPYVAGNCHTERDPKTGIMLHAHGPHIFHTNNERVWNYVRCFGEFAPFTNRVKAITAGRVFSLPINLLTLNQFFSKTLSRSRRGCSLVLLAITPSPIRAALKSRPCVSWEGSYMTHSSKTIQ